MSDVCEHRKDSPIGRMLRSPCYVCEYLKEQREGQHGEVFVYELHTIEENDDGERFLVEKTGDGR